MSIPTNIKKPGFYSESDTSGADQALASSIKVLIIAQLLGTGLAAALDPVAISDAQEARDQFGEGSHLARMCEAALEANSTIDLTGIGLADAGGAAKSSGTFTFSGTATANGTVRLYVGDELIEVSVTSADNGATVAGNAESALDDRPDLPVTASVATAVVTVTAQNAGLQGEDIPLEADTSDAPGITCVVVQMSGGATDPNIQSALTVVYPVQYDIIVTSLNDATSLQALRNHLESVSGALEQRMGLGFAGFRGSLANATTLAGNVDSERVTIFSLPNTRTTSFELAAAAAAVVAGETDPAAPLNGYQVAGVHAPAIANRLTRSQQETALAGGLTPLEVTAGERVRLVRWVTTYLTNSSGSPSTTLLDGTTIRSLDYFRAAWKLRMEARFGPGAPATNRKMTTRNLRRLEAETLGLMYELEALEVLRDIDDFKDGVTAVESSTVTGRAEMQIPAPVVPGLHIIAATFNLTL